LQFRRGLLDILVNAGSGLLDLILRPSAGLGNGLATHLSSLLPSRLLILKYLLPRFAKPLLVIGGSRLGCGNIGAGFFHCALRPAPALRKNGS
jgi:hypothetical protein